MEQEILKRTEAWINNPYIDVASKQEIQVLKDAGDDKELTDRFYTELEFGTGGIRGVVGAGLNRMNIYNVRKATQGLADYAKKHFGGQERLKAVVCHDSRNTSPLFSQETIRVLTANGIEVYTFSYPSATPVLSFTIRYLKCNFGVNITASHNPPEYNGYKVFWNDGAQVISPVDKGIIDFVFTGNSADNASVNVVYTPLHGVGYRFVSKAAEKRGFKNIRFVSSQKEPDGNFPTVKSPNPEETSAYAEAIKTADPAADIIIATDPDADRIGCMIKGKNGQFEFISGNTVGILMLYQALKKRRQAGTLTDKSYIVTTVVSTPIAEKIAGHFGVKTHYCHTGFKNIAEVINREVSAGNMSYVFGFEESHGYLIGDFIRDKDGISAALMLAEITAGLKKEGRTVSDELAEIYSLFGLYADAQENFTLKGQTGKEKIKTLMAALRANPPVELEGHHLTSVADYKSQMLTDKIGKTAPAKIALAPSDTFALYYSQDVRITARPSGTEPKLNFILICPLKTNLNWI
ncbi:hypothetical protein CHS0354_035295 [Potamilus streckersoni]|uniref:Phosphoglucomutase n=1 Tax=Potamilus streckersoni TaxID=2493646 RepID=A0AAE0S2Y5_9BIVA|nr:hypothetical protein CHS0354_035295 [Potamilus streckersoni]